MYTECFRNVRYILDRAAFCTVQSVAPAISPAYSLCVNDSLTALDVSSKILCIMFDKYRHCNCRLVDLPVASTEAILTADYGFV